MHWLTEGDWARRFRTSLDVLSEPTRRAFTIVTESKGAGGSDSTYRGRLIAHRPSGPGAAVQIIGTHIGATFGEYNLLEALYSFTITITPE